MNGLDRIGALALQVDDNTDLSAISSQTWGHYGFILTDAKWVVRNKTMEYTIWDGSQTLTVQEDYNNLNDRQARTAIGYDTLTPIDSGVSAKASGSATHVIDDVQLLDGGIQNFTFTAITGVSNDGKTVKFADGNELDVSSATILYVDSDGKTGIQDGSIKTAIKDKNGDLLANALYIEMGNSGDAELLVVDQLTYLKSAYYADDANLGVTSTGGVIYGADAVMDDTGTGNNQGGTTTSGNFTFTTTDKSTLTVDKASIQSNDGSVVFTVKTGSGAANDKTTFDWTVSVNGMPIEEGKNVTANAFNYVTTKVSAKDGDKITIALSNIVVKGASQNATAEDINNLLTQENATVTVTNVPAGEIKVPENATLTIGDNTSTGAVVIADGAVIGGEGKTVVLGDQNKAVSVGDVTISGDVDMSGAKPTVAENKTITVANGGALTIAAEPDNQPTGEGTLTVAAGGALAVDKVKDSNSSKTLVGPKDARIVTQSNTKVDVTFAGSDNATMTIAGDATIPEGQTWYSMFGPDAQKANGLDMTLSSGTLTVNGTLKLVSGSSGTGLTITNDAKVIVNGSVSIATKAKLVATEGAFVGGNTNASLIISPEAKNSSDTGSISGLGAGVKRPTYSEGAKAATYTWNGSAWATSSP